MHLQVSTFFDLDIKITRNVAQYPLHHVTYSPAKFDVATSNSLGEDAFSRRERSGSVVECLTRDRRVAGSSLTGVTALWSLSKTHLS